MASSARSDVETTHMGMHHGRRRALPLISAVALLTAALAPWSSAGAVAGLAATGAPAVAPQASGTAVAARSSKPRLAVSIHGLPGRGAARVTVTGPAGYRKAIQSSATLRLPGRGVARVSAASVTVGGRSYRPTRARQSVTVRRRHTSRIAVTYRVHGGSSSGGGGDTGTTHIPAGASIARYDIGEIDVRDLWVDAAHGSDGFDGSQAHPFRTINHAWAQVPSNHQLDQGFRIQVRTGRYSESMSPVYWEHRWGNAAHPIILNAVDGAHTVRLDADINMFDTKFFYLIGVDIIRDQDAFHCEQCDHVLLRNVELDGNATAGDGSASHDLLKVNQTQYFYVEDSDVHGAEDNAIDFVSVQSGHILGTTVHAAGDWCAYTKGGSAYITVADNELYDCGVGGFTAGQGTGFEFMVSPWLSYEAMGITVVNNVIHDTNNAGLGVQGGYNVLLAYNTLYRVGKIDSLLLFQQGSRSCDAHDAGVSTAACAANLNRGGWGTATTGGEWIPNRHVYVYNNVIDNPSGYQSQWQQFSVHGAASPPAWSNIAASAPADQDLRIVGNVLWNGPADLPLGVGDGSGCAPSNSTCNETVLKRDNHINNLAPTFVDAARHDFIPTGALAASSGAAIPAFAWTDVPLGAPAGSTANEVDKTRAGAARDGWGRPGAY